MITKEILQEVNKQMRTVPIKGKNYVMVNERIKGFRTALPGGRIETEILSLEDGVVTMKASIYDEEGRLLATGHAQEKETSSNINKTSCVENCETSAVGRALGIAGWGIDDSLGSADEVANAILNQEEGKKKAPGEKIAELRGWAEELGVEEAKLSANIGKPLDDMTNDDYGKLWNKLKATERKQKKGDAE